MTGELIILGGAEEIGANSSYLNLNETGFIVDAGLHPQKRNRDSLPHYEHIEFKPTDAFILTHAHTDHLGGVPYMMKFNPHIRMIATRPTRDLCEIMLQNTVKLLRRDAPDGIPPDTLSLYDYTVVERMGMLVEGYQYEEDIAVTGKFGMSDVNIRLYDAGHILGSAAVQFTTGGKTVLHTGDVQFHKQDLLPGASLPRHHVDALIMECTNGATENAPTRDEEKQRLADFINMVSNRGGSVLLPTFALGKTQEVLKLVHGLMLAGKIPTLPIYSGGMSRKISVVYDRYCYAVPRVHPGFEMTDIPQRDIVWEELYTGDYFREPSIVIASSGMMNVGSTSFLLVQRWMRTPHFGIAFTGWLDPNAPGYELLHSPKNESFIFAGRKAKRKCDVDKFRFSAHATREDLMGFVMDVKPKKVFLIHGDTPACESIGAQILRDLPQTKVCLPQLGKSYSLFD
jgi:Cft2 family RNA processing exonuclease